MRDSGKGLGFGIFLLTVGILWLLYIAKIVTLSTLYALFTLWPLILVAIGIGIVFRNNRLVRTATWLVLLAVVVCYGYFAAPSKGPVIINNPQVANTKVTLEKLPQTEKGELSIAFGITQLFVDSAASGLLDANVSEGLVQHTQSMKDGDRTVSTRFEMKGFNLASLKNTNKLRNDFHLNSNVIWKLDLETGAIDGSLDMTGLKVEKLNIDTGFSKLKLNMGSYNTAMKINAGASQIDITLPSDTGMKIKLDGGLNNTNLDSAGWVKKGDWHLSPGYDSKNYKIEADVDLGVGKLTVENR